MVYAEAPNDLADDYGGDQLNALLCAIRATRSWTRETKGSVRHLARTHWRAGLRIHMYFQDHKISERGERNDLKPLTSAFFEYHRLRPGLD